MDLEGDRSGGHRVHVGLQHEDRPEPGRDGLAVVVGMMPGADAVQRGPEPGHQRGDQHDVHELVVLGGGHEHRSGGAPAVDQDHDSGERAEPGDAADQQGIEVVQLLADPHRLGQPHRNQQTDDVADQDEEDAEVEQRRADPQQPGLVQLGGAGGPAELVVAVAPDGAADQDRQRDVGEHAPQQHLHRVALSTNGSSRGSYGSRPTASRGGPERAIASAACRSAGEAPGSVSQTACSTAPYAALRSGQGESDQFQAGPIALQQVDPVLRADHRGVLQHDRQVVRQLTAQVHQEAAAAVVLLHLGQHLAAAAGVAVGPVGQVEGVLAGEVEQLDIVGLQLRQRLAAASGRGARRSDRTARRRRLGQRLPQQIGPARAARGRDS